MYTTTKSGRTGYGNKAYANRGSINSYQVSGWILLLLGFLSLLFLYTALRRKNGFEQSWHSVLAMVLQETVADAIMKFLINAGSD